MMSEEQEMVQMGIIDSLLYASYFGCENGVLKEGDYSLTADDDDTTLYNLVLSVVDGYSIMGIMHYRMFYGIDDLDLGQFSQGNTYYVYAEYSNGMEEDPTQFTINSYTEEQPSVNTNLLLCIVDYTDVEPSLDTNVNKTYIKNIINHTMNSNNPHGENLIQNNLLIQKNLLVNNQPVYGAVYGSFISSNSSQSISVPTGYKPVFATVYPENTDAGYIAWSISGNSVVFSTSGNSGIKCNVKIEVEQDQ